MSLVTCGRLFCCPTLMVGVCWLTIGDKDLALPVSGSLLEISGLGIVVWGIKDTRQLFRLPKYRDLFFDCLRRFRRGFPKRLSR